MQLRTFQTWAGVLIVFTASVAIADSTSGGAGRLREAIDQLLNQLRTERTAVEADVKQLVDQMAELMTEHPEVRNQDVLNQEVATMSSAFVAAQLATLNAHSQYAEGHPVIHSAEAQEEAMREEYEQARQKHKDLSSALAEQEKLRTLLRQKERMFERLSDQIERMQELSLLADALEEPPATQPATGPARD